MALTMDGDVITVEDSDPVAVAARVRHLEEQIAGMPPEAVEAMSTDIGVVHSWLTGVLAKVTTRASTLQRQGQRSDPKKTAAKAGLGDREAAQATKRAEAMQKMPEALGALEDGKIGVGHADALTRQANRLSGAKKTAFEQESDRLVADAVRDGLSVAEFEKRCRDAVDRLMGDDGIGELEKQRRNSRARTFEDPATGMTHVRGEWDPVRGEAISKSLKAEIAARVAAGAKNITPRQQAQLSAEALHALICGQRQSKVESGAVGVLIDLNALIDGDATAPDGTRRTAETYGGHPLPVETIRRIACDAGIIPIVLNGDSQPLDVGRERRLATRAQRMALRARYPTCGMDAGCNVPFDDCQIHHIDPWKHGGHTDLDRMVPGCDHHHHLIHEGGWTLHRQPNGTWQLHPPQKPPP
jgi:hypothetical protein